MQQSTEDYKKLFTELIQKQIVVLGPDITLAKVKNIPGIQVDQNGTVTDIQGDPQALLQNLINQFVELSGLIVKKTMESILTSYPGAASLSSVLGSQQQASGLAQSQAPVFTPPPVRPDEVGPGISPEEAKKLDETLSQMASEQPMSAGGNSGIENQQKTGQT